MKFKNHSIFSLIFIFLFVKVTFSQRETENWYFGNTSSISFLKDNPEVINDSKMNAPFGCSSISNKNGELLFYTNGTEVFNKNHIKISGKGLASDMVSSQNVIIIPKPESKTIFYIFTIKTETTTSNGDGFPSLGKINSSKQNDLKPGLYYSTLDMAQNNGNGKVIESNVLILEKVSQKITAVHHKNGKDIWLATHTNKDDDIFYDDFYTILISSSGVQNPKLSNMGETLYIFDKVGHMKFSPNGEYLALASNTSGGWIFKFDNENGTINQPRRLGFATGRGDINSPYSVEFSIDSNKLYFETKKEDQIDVRLYQFEMSKVFQNNARATSFNFILGLSKTNAGGLQLAKNGKIYNAMNSGSDFTDSKPYLSVINSPEKDTENAIDFQENSFFLKNGGSRKGLPNFIQSYFRTRILNEKGCINTDLFFKIDSYTNIQSAKWDFGDGITSNEISPKHQFSNPGKYLIKAIVFLNDHALELSKEIEIFELPILNLNQKIIQCDSGTNENFFNLTEIEQKLVSNSDKYLFFYFKTEKEAKIGFPSILNFENYKSNSSSETIYARVVDENGCYNIVSFNLLLSNINLGNVTSMYTCGFKNNNQTEGLFDLSEKRSAIRNSLNLNNSIEITFFSSYNDAQTKRNELPDNFTSQTTKIWARADNATGCGGISSFDAIVNNQPQISNVLDNYTICINPTVNPITISANNTNDRIEWKDDKGNTISTSKSFPLSTIGKFTLIAYKTQNGIECSYKKTFSVNYPEEATFSSITVNTENETNNIVKVSVNGNSNYEFSLDNIFFQGNSSTFTFTNVAHGLKTIYVRDVNKCEKSITTKVSVLGFKKFFTPNNDGKNDYWNVNGLDKNLYKSINIMIYNRFGRVIFSIKDFDSKGWDGNFKGKPQPANNYWYTAFIIDNDNNNIKKTGYFSLIRN